MITPGYSLTSTERILPALALDFTTASLDARITFARALNTATRVNSSGYIETVSANTPRFDYNPSTLACRGLLIEASAENLLTYSSQIDNAVWIGGFGAPYTVTPDAAVAPDNTQTADLGQVRSTNTQRRQQTTLVVGSTYTASVYVKQAPTNSATHFRLTTRNTSAWNTGTTAKIALANSWQRVTTTWTQVGVTDAYTVLGAVNASGGADPDCYGDVLIWGAQTELGSVATSFIPTVATSVVRNADNASMALTQFPYNASQGAISVSYYPSNTGGYIAWSVTDGGFANRMQSQVNTPDYQFYVEDNSNLQANLYAGNIVANADTKLVGAYKQDSFAASLNGAAPATDTSGVIPTVTTLYIGRINSAGYLNGHVQKLLYWPQRILNAEVQAFSKP